MKKTSTSSENAVLQNPTPPNPPIRSPPIVASNIQYPFDEPGAQLFEETFLSELNTPSPRKKARIETTGMDMSPTKLLMDTAGAFPQTPGPANRSKTRIGLRAEKNMSNWEKHCLRPRYGNLQIHKEEGKKETIQVYEEEDSDDAFLDRIGAVRKRKALQQLPSPPTNSSDNSPITQHQARSKPTPKRHNTPYNRTTLPDLVHSNSADSNSREWDCVITPMKNNVYSDPNARRLSEELQADSLFAVSKPQFNGVPRSFDNFLDRLEDGGMEAAYGQDAHYFEQEYEGYSDYQQDQPLLATSTPPKIQYAPATAQNPRPSSDKEFDTGTNREDLLQVPPNKKYSRPMEKLLIDLNSPAKACSQLPAVLDSDEGVMGTEYEVEVARGVSEALNLSRGGGRQRTSRGRYGIGQGISPLELRSLEKPRIQKGRFRDSKMPVEHLPRNLAGRKRAYRARMSTTPQTTPPRLEKIIPSSQHHAPQTYLPFTEPSSTPTKPRPLPQIPKQEQSKPQPSNFQLKSNNPFNPMSKLNLRLAHHRRRFPINTALARDKAVKGPSGERTSEPVRGPRPRSPVLVASPIKKVVGVTGSGVGVNDGVSKFGVGVSDVGKETGAAQGLMLLKGGERPKTSVPLKFDFGVRFEGLPR